MIGMKDQCFGVEVEMTGLTRRQAVQALANYFGTEPYYVGGGYDKWCVKDPDGKVWSIMSDSSIVTEMKTESGYSLKVQLMFDNIEKHENSHIIAIRG